MYLDLIKIFLPTTVAFFLGLIFAPIGTHFFYKYKMWKKYSRSADAVAADFTKIHNEKEELNTPRIGGTIIWVSVIATVLIFYLTSIFIPSGSNIKMNFLSRGQTLIPFFTLLLGSLIGLWDDLVQIYGNGRFARDDKSWRKWKALLIGLMSLFIGAWFFYKLGMTSVHIPFGGELFLGALIIPFFILVALATFSGGVIDGIDGLSGGVLASIFAAYSAIAYANNQIDIAAFSGVITGAILAFLWFNIPPARFYMGETGIMGLTITLATLAFLTDSVFILPIVALPLVATSLSVILQIISKKLRGGKRLFRLAPLHHRNNFSNREQIDIMHKKKIDRFFLIIVFLLLVLGIAMFVSASLGILAKDESTFYGVLRSQLFLGLGMGILGMYFCLKVDYKFWRKYSFWIFLISILLTGSVFIPDVGWSHGGARRWIEFGGFSLQPVEFLKFGFIIYFAAWLSWAKNRVQDFRFGALPLIIMLGIIALVLLKQPDTKSFILIVTTGLGMLFVSGVSMRYIFGIAAVLALALGTLVFFTPYLQERVKTFLDPAGDPRGSSYQIQQSLIGIGSGQIFGRGFGQSIQKFNYLPEPQGDSIFAVLGEELGFVGATAAVVLYLLFTLRGFRIANNSPDIFSRLLVSGIVILIIVQSFMHMASITGVFPLTGVPLPFMSHGGTSLMIYLMAIGIILQISKFKNKNI
ncbi:putative lipid II flippase FtsW [Candidatus Nomurabacteria bacterium]|nr:putative lipid II flippase FtsW [Candidatus Nomurabacteria bacterium]